MTLQNKGDDAPDPWLRSRITGNNLCRRMGGRTLMGYLDGGGTDALPRACHVPNENNHFRSQTIDQHRRAPAEIAW